MLLPIHNFIRRQGLVSLQQLAREFLIDELALQPMLAIWVEKGAIKKITPALGCQQRCYNCCPAEYYQFLS